MPSSARKKSKEDKKRIKRIKLVLIIVILASLAAILMIFFLVNKVNFLLKDELKIELSPFNHVIFVKNNEPVNINFTIFNNNLGQCNTLCNFSMTDLRNNKIIYSKQEVLGHNEERIERFELANSGKGSGQLIYNFEAECKNLRTFVCPSDEESRYQSALIVINYELTDDEKEVKNSIKNKLEIFNSKVTNLSLLINQSRIMIEKISYAASEKANFTLETDRIYNEFTEIETKRNDFFELWENESYILLYASLSDDNIVKTESLTWEISKIEEQTVKTLEKANNDFDILMEFEGNKDEILSMVEFYINERNKDNNNILNRISFVIGNINDDYIILKDNRSFSEEELNYRLNQNSRNLNEIIIDYKKTKEEGLSLLIYGEKQLNIKRNITEPSTYDNFNCSDLKILIAEIEKENNLTIDNQSSDNSSNLIENLNNTEFYNKNCKNESVEIPDVIEIMKMKMMINNIRVSSLNLKRINLIRLDLFANQTFLEDNLPECCIFGECEDCCESGVCDSENNYPIIFVHGHMIYESNEPNPASFTDIQKKLNNDGFLNAGELDLAQAYEINQGGILGRMNVPFTFRGSYYYITEYGIGDYRLSIQKSERIENYAIRLKEIISLIKYETGKDKVIIVAQSMGGLVTRDYLTIFGYDDVDKVIIINTPNHGVSGRVKNLCSVFGSKKECEDMSEGSIFLTRLNSQKIPEDAKIYVIRSVGCTMDNGEIGDGIVTNSSAYLEGAQNFVIKGKCTDKLQTSLHGDVLKPERYPEMYNLILDILKE